MPNQPPLVQCVLAHQRFLRATPLVSLRTHSQFFTTLALYTGVLTVYCNIPVRTVQSMPFHLIAQTLPREIDG